MLQTKVVEKIKAHILCSITFFLKSCCLWDNVGKCCIAVQVTDYSKLGRMRFTCWVTKASDTHSEYTILIALQRQEWLRERSSALRYTYVVCFLFHFTCPLLTMCFLLFVLFTPFVKIYSYSHIFLSLHLRVFWSWRIMPAGIIFTLSVQR